MFAGLALNYKITNLPSHTACSMGTELSSVHVSILIGGDTSVSLLRRSRLRGEDLDFVPIRSRIALV